MIYFSQQIAQMKQIYEPQALSCHPEQREVSQTKSKSEKFAARFLTSVRNDTNHKTYKLKNL